jgi:hypothetical protein
MRAGEAPDASDANKKAREDSWKRWKDILGSGSAAKPDAHTYAQGDKP